MISVYAGFGLLVGLFLTIMIKTNDTLGVIILLLSFCIFTMIGIIIHQEDYQRVHNVMLWVIPIVDIIMFILLILRMGEII